jgi:F-type H+-transporting ATPase subunit alpha
MDIRADEISKVIRDQIGSFTTTVDVAEVGTVISIGDGISRVHGIERAMAGEMLEFPHSVFGIALNLEEESVGAVLLGDFTEIKEGDQVKRTGRIISVPVGDEMLGRVVNALGQPIDGKGPITTKQFLPIERLAPGVVDRQPVKEPLQTGLKAIDGMVPIGRGQRELIIGDRQTGKTAVAVDAIINQRGKGVVCVYNAIGQKQSTVAQVVRTLEEFDAMSYTIVVAATASDSGADAVHQPVFSVRDWRILSRRRQARARRLRRPLEARAGVPRDFAAAAAAAGPRGVPGRRVLSALATARARAEVESVARRWIAHRAPDHRDAGG